MEKKYLCLGCEGGKEIKTSTIEGKTQHCTCPYCYGYGTLTLKQLIKFVDNQKINGY